jgi:hypothetical protein
VGHTHAHTRTAIAIAYIAYIGLGYNTHHGHRVCPIQPIETVSTHACRPIRIASRILRIKTLLRENRNRIEYNVPELQLSFPYVCPEPVLAR